MTRAWGCALIAIGMGIGFVYEAGITYYVTWYVPKHTHRSPMVGPDYAILSGLMGAVCGGLIAMAGEALVRTIIKRRSKDTTAAMRQAEAADEESVWPPPPKRDTAHEADGIEPEGQNEE